jgi:nitrite reductase (NADH) small subunit
MTATRPAPTSDRTASPPPPAPGSHDVCRLDDILPGTGVCALIDGQQIAVFRLDDGEHLHAIGNFDPSSRAMVLARGLVGDRQGRPIVASPITKLAFDLQTGRCLDDPALQVPVHAVHRAGDRVRIDLHPG